MGTEILTLTLSSVEGSGHEWLIHIFSAMTAGATSTSLTNPVWVIKTRFMVEY